MIKLKATVHNKNAKHAGSFIIPFPTTADGFFTRYSEVYIKKVIYNNPVTAVIWSDGEKTISKCHPDDVYDERYGLTLCVVKKVIGSKNYHNLLDTWDSFGLKEVDLNSIRRREKIGLSIAKYIKSVLNAVCAAAEEIDDKYVIENDGQLRFKDINCPTTDKNTEV